MTLLEQRDVPVSQIQYVYRPELLGWFLQRPSFSIVRRSVELRCTITDLPAAPDQVSTL